MNLPAVLSCPLRASRGGLIVALVLGVVPGARATLILLSDLRVITAWSTVSPGQSFTAEPFAPFSATASTFGSSGGMISTLSGTELKVGMGSSQFLDLTRQPSGTVVSTHFDALFQVSFRVDAPTPVLLTGYRDNETLGGLIASSLNSPAGNINLSWGGSMYNNFLSQSILLAPSVYTLTGQIAMTYTLAAPMYDGGTMRLDLALATVPEHGSGAVLLTLALGVAVLMRSRRVLRASG